MSSVVFGVESGRGGRSTTFNSEDEIVRFGYMAENKDENPIVKLHELFKKKAEVLRYEKPNSNDYHRAEYGAMITKSIDPNKWKIETPKLSPAEIIVEQRKTAIQTIDKKYNELGERKEVALEGILEHINHVNFGEIKNKQFAADVITRKGESWQQKLPKKQ